MGRIMGKNWWVFWEWRYPKEGLEAAFTGMSVAKTWNSEKLSGGAEDVGGGTGGGAEDVGGGTGGGAE